MSDLYTMLQVSPRKKRCPPSEDDEAIVTPKKLRRQSLASKASTSQKKTEVAELPEHLDRLLAIQANLHRALSHALATSAVSPTSDTGIVPNVLNNHTLSAAAGLSRTCTVDDIKRLCWLWEWDGKDLPPPDALEDENPFLDDTPSEGPKQWQRGSMGMVITPTTYLSRATNKRTPAYGIGIEVEMDIDRGMAGGMAAVARWTSKGDVRQKELSAKLRRWAELHEKKQTVPQVPSANLPPLIVKAPKHSALTQRLASMSPKSPKSLSSPSKGLEPPSSPSRVPSSPTKPRVIPGKRTEREFAIPFPITPSSLPRKNSISSLSRPATPQTPRRTDPFAYPLPITPSTSSTSTNSPERPCTPVQQTGSPGETPPSTPSSSRRAALIERIRKRSESQPATPSKVRITKAGMSKDELLKLGQEETRRRCLLGRLGGIAESIWMLFTSPAQALTASPSTKKRKAIPVSEAIPAIIKSSPVPISAAEVQESIQMLRSLCPFFIKSMDIGGEEWLEMPSTAASSTPFSSPRKGGSDDELKQLSPRRVKRDAGGGLREVRERIKRELEADE
ncbi:hypothetical protein SCHPADRAFT_924102 [Schizopora paradoxa]|uniref:DNA replication factor Cdt1 C-terminal domain-containing protein n=1 Tax=Schizopora paradoxa TaxID=27342 RepID=A0A0H2S668_9AGAM|nr:hypothetical protein SCHPADRAFT_924102 [Schizopora paradoxa]